MPVNLNLDKAKSVRTGEELDVSLVTQWLENIEPELHKSLLGVPTLTQYSGGASNWTYCLSFENKEIILRRAPKGTKAKGAHDMAREYRLQKALKPVYSYVPEMLALCEDESIIGTPFYIMEKLSGIIPRSNFPRGLNPSSEDSNTLCKHMLDAMIELHNVDYKAANLAGIAKGEGYIDRQISGWSDRFSRAKTWNVPSGKKVMAWLESNKPAVENICLTHNDFRLDNLVLDPEDISNVTGVLDWELATLGDPLMDLGNTLAYWVEEKDDFIGQSTRRQPTHLKGMMTRKEVIAYYCEKRGIAVDDFTFYEVYGLFRLVGIIQQIYYRYHHKQTNNPAFKNFWILVHYLLWRCNRIIKHQKK